MWKIEMDCGQSRAHVYGSVTVHILKNIPLFSSLDNTVTLFNSWRKYNSIFLQKERVKYTEKLFRTFYSG